LSRASLELREAWRQELLLEVVCLHILRSANLADVRPHFGLGRIGIRHVHNFDSGALFFFQLAVVSKKRLSRIAAFECVHDAPPSLREEGI
jgi:hypothetical protein